MRIELKALKADDGNDIYLMLQDIENDEFGFTNEVKGMDFEAYKCWLEKQSKWSQEMELPNGYVGQTTYWLYIDGNPVGYGKIRHQLTPALIKSGGTIGYAISKNNRGKGYGTIFLRELLSKYKMMGFHTPLLTIMKRNKASIKVAEKNGGKQSRRDDDWYYYTFDL